MAVEDELRLVLAAPDDEPLASLFRMMQYHLGWVDQHFAPLQPSVTGKRLRPVLCLLACEGVGGEWRRAVPAAAAIELIHNFSLIHDDIQDQDHVRHHRPTVWHLWGVAQGINTGDAMWALARLAAHRLTQQGYSAEVVLAAIAWLDRTCLKLCQGQHLDLWFEQTEMVSPSAYVRMISGKTAALLSACTGLGALLGQAPPTAVKAMAEFGHALGLAFQVTDDILGIWGDPSVTGKPAASDIVARKKSLPVVYAMQQKAERGGDLLRQRYAQRDSGANAVAELLALIEATGARAHAERLAQEHLDAALHCLHHAGLAEEARQQIAALAVAIGGRSF
jgi:geranylgeranyl diphosphate synthase type I